MLGREFVQPLHLGHFLLANWEWIYWHLLFQARFEKARQLGWPEGSKLKRALTFRTRILITRQIPRGALFVELKRAELAWRSVAPGSTARSHDTMINNSIKTRYTRRRNGTVSWRYYWSNFMDHSPSCEAHNTLSYSLISPPSLEPKVTCRVHRSLPLVAVLRQMNQSTPSHTVSLLSILILSYGLNLGLHSGFSLQVFQPIFCVHFCLPVTGAINVRLWVLMAAGMKFRVFWNIAPCSHVEKDRRFISAYCLHHQGNESKLQVLSSPIPIFVTFHFLSKIGPQMVCYISDDGSYIMKHR
jgi:hypothetical protein